MSKNNSRQPQWTSEEDLFRQLAKSLGIKFDKKAIKPKQKSPYYDETGKRYGVTEATRHEIVYDKQGRPMPNPVARNIESYPLMPTPVGNAIETVANASAEIHPLLGLIAGAVPWGNKKPPRNSKMNNPYMDEYRNSLGGYGPNANDYVDGAIDAYGNGKNRKVYDLPSHTDSKGMNGVMVQGNNVGIKLSPEEVKKIQAGVQNDRITQLQESTQRAVDLPDGVYPSLNNDNNVQPIYPFSLQQRVDDMYGDGAIDFMADGATELGYMRGVENRKPRGGKLFAKTTAQFEKDIESAGVAGQNEHAGIYSTSDSHGAGLEDARRYSRDNNNAPVVSMITPGGNSWIDISTDWDRRSMTGEGANHFFSEGKKYNIDPAFQNMELGHYGDQMNEIVYGGKYSADPLKNGKGFRGKNKGIILEPQMSEQERMLGGYPLEHFLDSEWIKRTRRGDKYPVINNKDHKVGFPGNWTMPGQPFKNKDGSLWLSDEWTNDMYQKRWDMINDKEISNWGDVHFMDRPVAPQGLMKYLNDGQGYLGNMRLSAKPSRIDNLALGRVGKPILDEAGNPTGKVFDAPFTRQFHSIIGDKSKISPRLFEQQFGRKGLFDAVSQLRSAQGLTDPNNPIISRGFGDSNYIEHIMKNMTNKDKELARNAWKLGVVPPMLLQDDEE